MGKLARPFISPVVVQPREKYPLPRLPLTTCSRWETWSWGHEIMRAAPTPTNSSTLENKPCTVELTLMARAWASPALRVQKWESWSYHLYAIP